MKLYEFWYDKGINKCYVFHYIIFLNRIIHSTEEKPNIFNSYFVTHNLVGHTSHDPNAYNLNIDFRSGSCWISQKNKWFKNKEELIRLFDVDIFHLHWKLLMWIQSLKKETPSWLEILDRTAHFLVFPWAMSKKVILFLTEYGILPTHQLGFHKNGSTVTAIFSLI